MIHNWRSRKPRYNSLFFITGGFQRASSVTSLMFHTVLCKLQTNNSFRFWRTQTSNFLWSWSRHRRWQILLHRSEQSGNGNQASVATISRFRNCFKAKALYWPYIHMPSMASGRSWKLWWSWASQLQVYESCMSRNLWQMWEWCKSKEMPT